MPVTMAAIIGLGTILAAANYRKTGRSKDRKSRYHRTGRRGERVTRDPIRPRLGSRFCVDAAKLLSFHRYGQAASGNGAALARVYYGL